MDDKVCLCFGPPVDDCPIHGKVNAVDMEAIDKLVFSLREISEALKRDDVRGAVIRYKTLVGED